MLPKSAKTGSLKRDLLFFAFMMTLLAANILGFVGLAISAVVIADMPLLTLWYALALVLGAQNFLILRDWFLDRSPSRPLIRYGRNSLIILGTGLLIAEFVL